MVIRTRAASHCQHWESIASAKRLAIYNEIPEKWRLRRAVIRRYRKKRCIVGKVIEELLDAKTRQITELSTEDLLARIAAGVLSCADATRAFCKRSAYAHQLVGVCKIALRCQR
jgi:amidase